MKHIMLVLGAAFDSAAADGGARQDGSEEPEMPRAAIRELALMTRHVLLLLRESLSSIAFSATLTAALLRYG